MFRCAVGMIADRVRLQQAVHHTALGNGQLKQTVFVEPFSMHEVIVFNAVTVNGMILAERALIDTAVGEDKKIFSHRPGALEEFVRVEIHFGINDMDAESSSRRSHFGNYVQPLFRLDLPVG